jgi:pantoate--beta-alanine ligase
MIILRTIGDTQKYLARDRKPGKSAGLVPTMGALHEGHLSLLKCCKSENDASLEKDLHMLGDAGCDMVFVPDVMTIYPEPDNRIFDFGKLDKIMEGASRPGHFNGVAQVVSRLFQITEPDRAYFGEKDFQQLAIIRKMTRMLKLPVQIRSCPTLRESDGLAMSSRNILLSPEQRKSAALINRTLNKAASMTDLDVVDLKIWVIDTINQDPLLRVEYFEIVNPGSLRPARRWRQGKKPLIGCIAVGVGKVRLIDNIFFLNFVPS